MKLFTRKNILSIDDLVLLSMLNFPEGAIGESSIHEFLYYLTMESEFSQYHKLLDYKTGDDFCFSEFIHRSIESNTKDMKTAIEHVLRTTSDQSWAMFSDELKFDLFETILAKEVQFSTYIKNYYPKVFYLSGSGLSIAKLIAKTKLNPAQRKLLKSLAK